MNTRIAICDGDIQTREYIIANIRELTGAVTCAQFDNVYDVQEEFEADADAYDILCISATLQKRGDGISAAEKIRQRNLKTTIIIIADNRDYYAQAFDMFAMAYLIKPIQYQQIERCYTFYTKNNRAGRRASWMVKNTGGSWKRIFCRDITYIESSNREVAVHLVNGDTIRSYGKLADVVSQLSSEQIIRCHQSYIVNMYYISELKTGEIEVENVKIPISRKYQKLVREQYYKYMFGQM